MVLVFLCFYIMRTYGIIFLISIFIYSLTNKLSDIQGLYQKILKKNLPFPEIATFIAIFLQLFGLIFIINKEFNFTENKFIKKYQDYGKYLLITFTLLTIYFYHNIFIDKKQKINFLKNTSIIGGLLLI